MNIGMIAHDAKKKLMQNFCIAYRAILAKNEVYATGTTKQSGWTSLKGEMGIKTQVSPTPAHLPGSSTIN